MKKNSVLYILLVVLIIMNGFFLYNYLGRPEHKGPKENDEFIVKALGLNGTQLKQFKSVEKNHHDSMKNIGDNVKVYKDELFRKILASEVNQGEIDSLIRLISEKEILKEKAIFNRLRGIYNLCNAEQKQRFSNIIKKARRPDGPGADGPRGGRPNRPE